MKRGKVTVETMRPAEYQYSPNARRTTELFASAMIRTEHLTVDEIAKRYPSSSIERLIMNDSDIKKKLKEFETRLQFHDEDIDNAKEILKAAKEAQENTVTELRAFMRDVDSKQERLL